jgi:hypothetical protein
MMDIDGWHRLPKDKLLGPPGSTKERLAWYQMKTTSSGGEMWLDRNPALKDVWREEFRYLTYLDQEGELS